MAAATSDLRSTIGAILTIVAFVAGWYALQRWVPPALGCET